MIENTKIISYYTPNYEYPIYAAAFKNSADKFGLDHYVKMVESRGGWGENTRFKSKFIRETLDLFPEHNLCFVDVDSLFKKLPIEILNIVEEDIAYTTFDWLGRRGITQDDDLKRFEISSAIFWVRNNEKAREFLDFWVEELTKHPIGIWEQKVLAMCLNNKKHWMGALWKDYMRIKHLPMSYMKIFDTMTHLVSDPVIETYQASRAVRRGKPNKGPQPIIVKSSKKLTKAKSGKRPSPITTHPMDNILEEYRRRHLQRRRMIIAKRH